MQVECTFNAFTRLSVANFALIRCAKENNVPQAANGVTMHSHVDPGAAVCPGFGVPRKNMHAALRGSAQVQPAHQWTEVQLNVKGFGSLPFLRVLLFVNHWVQCEMHLDTHYHVCVHSRSSQYKSWHQVLPNKLANVTTVLSSCELAMHACLMKETKHGTTASALGRSSDGHPCLVKLTMCYP